MLKVLVEKWNKNKERLSKALRRTDLEHVDYKDLVRLTLMKFTMTESGTRIIWGMASWILNI